VPPVTVDLITRDPSGHYSLILVEEGPWAPGTEQDQLRRLQDRLYDYVDVAIDGHLAKLHPDAAGRPVKIQLDGYDLPNEAVAPFIARFSEHIRTDPQFATSIGAGRAVLELTFEYNGRTLRDTGTSIPEGDG
jgi:hypothetical protein